MVFAESMHKIKTDFALKRWTEFTAGIDVWHVSSAMAAGLWALEPMHIYKVAEWYHRKKEAEIWESIELAQEILKFYAQKKKSLSLDI